MTLDACGRIVERTKQCVTRMPNAVAHSVGAS